ncbi:MAG: response regulator [Deltaproteobacteria bacterium]|nr:response regulator [Deltaproteobacteria bacterium]
MTEVISTTAFAGKTVLLIDDDDFIVDVVRQSVGPVVSALEVAKDGVDALEILKKKEFDILLLDLKMPRMNGVTLINHLRDLKPHLLDRTIVITGNAETKTVRAFISDNGCMYLPKPFNVRELYGAMTALVQGGAMKSVLTAR